MKKIQCVCGQENELIESPEGLRYNKERHGNGELCNGKCFNCNKPLKDLLAEPEAAKNGLAKKEERQSQSGKKAAKKGKGKSKAKAKSDEAGGEISESQTRLKTNIGNEGNIGSPAGEGE